MRVLHFSPFGALAGANRSMLVLLKELRDRIDVRLLTMTRNEPFAEAQGYGIDAQPLLDAKEMSSRLRRWPPIVRGLRREITRWQRNTVHGNSPMSMRYLWPAAIGKPVRTICHQRDYYKKDYFHLAVPRADYLIATSQFIYGTLPERLQSSAPPFTTQ